MPHPDRRTFRPHPATVDDFMEDGRLALANLDNGNAFALNRTAAHIWGKLTEGASANEVVASVSERFSVGVEQAIESVDSLLQGLLAAEMIVPGNGAALYLPRPSPMDRAGALKAVGRWLSPDHARVEQRGAGFWPAMVAIVRRHRMAPAIWCAISSTPEIPSLVAEHLAALYEANRRRNRSVRQQLEEAVAALNRKGIEPLLLKGTSHLFAGAFPDPAQRVIGDIDLLLPAGACDAGAAALQELGYRFDHAGGPDYRVHHHLAPLVRPGSAPVELHRSPVPEAFVRPLAGIEARSVRVPHPDLKMRVAAPGDRLVHLAVHCQGIDGHLRRGILPLGALHEYAWLRHRFGDELDWPRIWNALGDRRDVLDSLAHAALHLTAMRLPPGGRRGLSTGVYLGRGMADEIWPPIRRINRRLGRLLLQRAENEGQPATAAVSVR